MLFDSSSGISFFKEAIKSLGMKSDMNMQINAAKQPCYNRQERNEEDSMKIMLSPTKQMKPVNENRCSFHTSSTTVKLYVRLKQLSADELRTLDENK